uniref:G domain-containing protein n=1 Tax=Neolamprologus brichardi TaxID=32507 RepID=A0A3Q4I9L1_NEOBR
MLLHCHILIAGTPPPPPPPPLSPQRDLLLVRDYKPHKDVQHLRILLYGPPGAGKSSFINSVDSVLRGKIATRALAAATSGDSFTIAVCMRMYSGLQKYSITGYEIFIQMFVHSAVIQKLYHAKSYNSFPTLDDKVHILVSVIPADTVSIMNDETVRKMKDVRSAARIPQIAIMTKIDEACPEVKKDIKNVYKSKYLNKQMEAVSVNLGIPLNCIFLMKNYHTEIETENDVDSLILSVLKKIIDYGEDYLNDQDDPDL